MPAAPHDPYAALRFPGYRTYTLGRSFFFLASQMQTVAVTWDIYQRLRLNLKDAAMAMGYIGLVQVLPIIFFALPAGQVADRFSRKTIVMTTQLLFALCALGFFLLSRTGAPVALYYVLLFIAATGRAFTIPAVSALFTTLVPREVLPNASMWNSTVFQLSAMAGPMLGGFIVAGHGADVAGPQTAYLVNIGLAAVGFFMFRMSAPIMKGDRATPITFESLLSGVKFVFKTRFLLALMSLDLFAVLLGGATALLPIFASDILHVGGWGFGLLRAAPSTGAVFMALLTAHLKPWKQAGRAMLWAVAGYGVATLVFGLSKWFWLSFAALALTGAFDNISVVVRQTLTQMITPNQMRGRVSSVSSVFISCSNELGEFESGFTARLFGPVGSVILGGIGTLCVVLGAALIFPELKRLGQLHEMKPIDIEKATDEQLVETGN